MVVIESLLRLWRRQGHRVLLFSQTKMMLDIMEQFVVGEGYTYKRMDGTTPISTRQPLINQFNKVILLLKRGFVYDIVSCDLALPGRQHLFVPTDDSCWRARSELDWGKQGSHLRP